MNDQELAVTNNKTAGHGVSACLFAGLLLLLFTLLSTSKRINRLQGTVAQQII
jgi:hypothetical protein